MFYKEIIKKMEQQEKKEKKRKRRKRSMSFESRLERFGKAITLSLRDEELRQYAGKYGYTKKRLEKGKALFEKAEKLYQKHKSKLAEQMEASRLFYQLRDKAHKTYLHIIETCRLAFANQPSVIGRLQLKGKRKRDFGGWSMQTKYFYKMALADETIIRELSKHNAPKEELEKGKQQVLDTMAAHTRQIKARAQTQRITALKNKAFKELEAWMGDYFKVMKVALKHDNQQLEKLGFIVPAGI
jgi:hypothetical protein